MTRRYLVPAIATLFFGSTQAMACLGYTVTATQVSGTGYSPSDAIDTPLTIQLSASTGPLPSECENVEIRIEGLPGDPRPLQFFGGGGVRLVADLLPGPDATLAFTSLVLTPDARARLVRGQPVTVQIGEFKAGQFLQAGSYSSTMRVIAGTTEVSELLTTSVEPAMLLQLSSEDGVEDIILAGDPQTGTSGSTVFFYRTNTNLRVSVASQNNGALIHQRGASVGRIRYNAALDGIPLNFAGGPATVDFGFTQTNLQSRTIFVEVPAAGPLPAGRYEDVITFSFAAD
jgi:hypothetical protein